MSSSIPPPEDVQTNYDASAYKAQGDGPHPTLAGNMYDPNVSADGHMNRGVGVGGMSEERTRQEGLEHIKNNSGLGDQSTAGSGQQYSTGTSSYGGAPASDLTSSSARGADTYGTSGTTGSTGGQFTEDGVAMGSSSMGSSGMGSSDLGSSNLGSSNLGSSSNAERGDAADGSGSRAPDYDPATTVSQPHDITEGGPAVSGAGATAAAMGTKDPEKNTEAQSDTPLNSKVDEDPSTHGGEAAQSEEKSQGTSAGGKGGKLDNPESIPTAGGERLGKAHWGESKVVPENPKVAGEEKVASKAGQPNDQTRDNTSKNTGAASSTDDTEQSGEHKEGMMEKLKHMVGK